MGIKRLEKDPDHKNVYDSLIDDAVGRNKNLWQFACFCSAQEGRCSIALDGGWGTGKTFFLKHLETLFDAYSENTEQLSAEEQETIKEHFKDYGSEDTFGMTIKPHVCVYYDAWLNDNAEDPMRSILYCLIKCKSEQYLKQLNTNEGIKNKAIEFTNNVKVFAKRLCQFNPKNDLILDAIAPLEPFIPLGLGKITDSIKASNPTHEIEVQERFHYAFDEFLKTLIPSDISRLLILIDELDRCKPTYAVQLLERIKHYFSNERITFVFAVNNKELQKTIAAFYGDEFDANLYLDKFFDYRLSLPAPSNLGVRKLLKLETEGNHLDAYKRTCERFIEHYSLSLREAIKYCQWVKIVCETRPESKSDADAIVWKFIINILIPIVLGLKYKDENILNKFMAGEQLSLFRAIVSNDNSLSSIVHYFYLLIATGTELEQRALDGIPVDKVEVVYRAIFYPKQKKDYLRQQGYILFDEWVAEEVISASNFMADFIKYDTNTEETAHG